MGIAYHPDMQVVERPPVHEKFATKENRIQSFGNESFCSRDPQYLADAGFFRFGRKEGIVCFWCDLGFLFLYNIDNVWHMHGQFSKGCGFLLRKEKIYRRLARPVVYTYESKVYPKS
jgi:Inhibitor of Apoptosis domain